MSRHEEGIIREAAAAAQMARLHGCTIEVSIKRFGFRTDVSVKPDGVPHDAEATGVMPAVMPTREALAEIKKAPHVVKDDPQA